MKTIYEFEIKTSVEIEKVETKEENGSTISITKKEVEEKPIFFAIKKPSRVEKEEGEMYRAVHFAKCVESGIITQAALRKKYGDTGGIYTNEEEQEYSILRQKLKENIEQFQFIGSGSSDLSKEEKEKREKELLKEMFDIRNLIVEFENSATLFYQDTAESKARNKLIEYFILTLTLFKENDGDEWKPFFKGSSIGEKLQYLSNLEDNEDKIYLQVGEKLAFIITLILTSPNITKEEIKSLQEDLV